MTNESTSHIDKRKYERLWANKEAKVSLSSDSYTLWSNLESTHRVYLGVGRVLLVWTYEAGAPKPRTHLNVAKAELNLASGLKLHVANNEFTQAVTHVPARLGNLPVFAWIPYFSELRWAPASYESYEDPKFCTLPVCFKTASNSINGLTEGDTYISTVMQFRQEWPAHKNLQF